MRGFLAIIFDASLIIAEIFFGVFNWNLTLIIFLGIVVAVFYASLPCDI